MGVNTTNQQRHRVGARSNAATRQRLEQELDALRSRRRELDDAARATDGVDDRGDAAQRLEWAEERSLLDDRIDEIIGVLHGRVDAVPTEALADGTEVTVRFSDGSVETMKVVVIPEEAPDFVETVTWDSPLGQALVGARPVTRSPTPARTATTSPRYLRSVRQTTRRSAEQITPHSRV